MNTVEALHKLQHTRRSPAVAQSLAQKVAEMIEDAPTKCDLTLPQIPLWRQTVSRLHPDFLTGDELLTSERRRLNRDYPLIGSALYPVAIDDAFLTIRSLAHHKKSMTIGIEIVEIPEISLDEIIKSNRILASVPQPGRNAEMVGPTGLPITAELGVALCVVVDHIETAVQSRARMQLS